MKQKQVHIYYSGQVQGVGFRYRTQRIAEMYPISGWVRNLTDGRVEVLAQADEKDLEDFITQVDDQLGIHIRNKQIAWNDKPDTQYKGFYITI
jgi:acylphosphatase